MATAIDKIKVWIAPTLFTGVTYLLWADISEMKSDVKKLLAESEYRRAVIETLKGDVEQLKKTVYYNKSTSNNNPKIEFRDISYFIAEDIFRIKKNKAV